MRRRTASVEWQRGQGVVEFALILPVFMLLLLGLLEFGQAFNHHISLEYATREGARSGAALANGGGALGCTAGKSPNAATVDPLIIEAVQRVIKSTGSPLVVSDINEIRIYKADSAGAELGPVNVWTYTPGAGPTPSDSTTRLDFSPSGGGTWAACSRNNSNPADSIGVTISYTYRFRTGLANVMKFVGPGSGAVLTIVDRTVMSINPTAQ